MTIQTPTAISSPVVSPTDAELTDLEAVADEVAAVVAAPRVGPPNSFILHAPLEVLARRRLFGYVSADEAAALAPHVAHHLRAVAEEWQTFSTPVDPSDRPDLDEVDRAELARAIADSTAAAAHAPIFLASLRAEGDQAGRWQPMLAPLQMALDLHPDRRMRWFERRPPEGGGTPADLAEELASLPRLGRGESTFIHPMLQRAEPVSEERLAPLLPPLDADLSNDEFAAWRAVILRTATASMLLDTTDHAPYGWSHCLTLPLAVLQLAEDVGRARAVALAATHVLALRCALAEESVRPEAVVELARPVTPEVFEAEIAELAATGSRRHDAHLVKYSLATIEAAELDPEGAALHLAAGRRLRQWWDDEGGHPLDT